MISVQSVFSVALVVLAIIYYTGTNFFSKTPSIATKVLNDTYDYIIVGGGTAGAVLAARLSEDENVTVLVLEAGGDYTENPHYHIPFAAGSLQHSQADWAYYTEPQMHTCQGLKHKRNFWPSGRVLGGSSVLNFMVYSRGLAKDYDKWADLGCDGWSFKEVLPYFLKSENILIDELKESKFHGTGGPLGVSGSTITDLQQFYIKAGTEAGFENRDLNEMVGEGVSGAQLTIRKGIRSSTGLEFLEKAKGRKNLHIAVVSFVTKIKLENKRAVGVYVIRDNKKKPISSRGEVIVSAGAINSPKLLMHSGIGPSKILEELNIKTEADLPVGENLQNHFALIFNTKVNESLSITMNKAFGWKSLLEYQLFGSGYLSGPGAEAILLACSEGHGNKDCVPDLQIMFLSSYLSFNFIEAREDVFREYTKDVKDAEGFMMFINSLNPKSKGKLTLTSRDPYDAPKIEPNFLSSEEDLDSLIKGVKLAEKLVETETLKGIGASVESMRLNFCSAKTFRSDAYWRCVIQQVGLGLSHYTGTCKMGSTNDHTAVVDPQLRVKGIRGLRVVDASIMPNIVSGNTYAPVVMIAEKAADIIRMENRKH